MIAAAFLRPLWWMALGSLRLLIGLAIAALTLAPVSSAAQAASGTPSMTTTSRWVVGLPVDASVISGPAEGSDRGEANAGIEVRLAADQDSATGGAATGQLVVPVGRSGRSTDAPRATEAHAPGGAEYGWALGERAPPRT